MSNKPFQGAVEGLRLAEKYLALGEPERSFLFQSNAQTQATLALAHEQRTANLIAIATAVTGDGMHLLDPALVAWAQEQLGERIGFELTTN